MKSVCLKGRYHVLKEYIFQENKYENSVHQGIAPKPQQHCFAFSGKNRDLVGQMRLAS